MTTIPSQIQNLNKSLKMTFNQFSYFRLGPMISAKLLLQKVACTGPSHVTDGHVYNSGQQPLRSALKHGRKL